MPTGRVIQAPQISGNKSVSDEITPEFKKWDME
jgi:hypothetical protein